MSDAKISVAGGFRNFWGLLLCYTFGIIKSLEHLKNVKSGRDPYLGLNFPYASSKAKSISQDSPFNTEVG